MATDNAPLTNPILMPGSKTLVMGPTGTGKTYLQHTWLEAGVTPHIIFTEPGMTTIQKFNKDECKIHWTFRPAAVVKLDTLGDLAKKMRTMDAKSIAGMEDINKGQYNQLETVISALGNFTCDSCGKSFGAVDSWSTDKAIIIDSLSGLNIMALDLVSGMKPVRSQQNWGMAMDYLERIITVLCMGTRAHFCLTAHVDKEFDEVSGAHHITVAALGRKLAPKLPRFFDDVVLTKKNGKDFVLSNTAYGVDLKSRNLPLGDKLPPTMKEVVIGWKVNGGVIPTTDQ